MADPTIGGVKSGEKVKYLNINPAHPFIYIESMDLMRIGKMMMAAANNGHFGVACLDHYCYIMNVKNRCKDLPEQ